MSGMAEVLNVHHDWAFGLERGEVLCVGCDWSQQVGLIDPAAEVFRTHQAAMLTAAGFGPVKGEKRLMELAALMAYDAVEESALREAGAVALEEAAAELLSDESAPPKSIKEMYNAIYATWLQRRAAAVRGEG